MVAPKNSIIRELYESHAYPFTRVVRGIPTSWDASTTAITRPSWFELVVWSPCDKFIAITLHGSRSVDVLDSATLQQLQTLEFPQDISTDDRALIFSPDSRVLTCFSDDCAGLSQKLFAVSWDLQTGGVTNIISWWGAARDNTGTPSVTYSADGKMVGVYYRRPGSKGSYISICDVASGVLTHSHWLNNIEPLSNQIWTHGEYLQFATANTTTIAIWEAGFAPGAAPTEVETLPAPDGFEGNSLGGPQFHPALYRLAFVSQGRILVWDSRNSRYLLECTNAEFDPPMSFSSDGRFFACSTTGSDVHLWKESPAGYTLHGILTSSAKHPDPLLSGNGESIVVSSGCTIRLWHTKSFSTPPSSILTKGVQRTGRFILEFSPDEMFAVVTMREDNRATILNLRSGVQQLTIDANMEIYGLGVIGNTVVVIGHRKVTTWDLPAGYYVPGVRVGPEDSSRTIELNDPSHYPPFCASISPDSGYIALSDAVSLYIYRGSTGELLWKESTWGEVPWFSPDGRDVWRVGFRGRVEVWGVSDGRKVSQPPVDTEQPPEGFPWRSSLGYRVTNDWWIIDPDGKRLMLLPPPWQSSPVERVWKGRFLALLHSGRSEIVILELEVNRGL